jgi:hypothetical protein
MANKPRTPRQFTELVQRLMRADPVARFLDEEIPNAEPPGDTQKLEPPSNAEPPGDTQKLEPPAQKSAQKRRSGQKPVYDRDALNLLIDQHPDWTAKELLANYPAKGKSPSLRWVQELLRERRK